MPRRYIPTGRPAVPPPAPKRGPSKETLALGQRCLDLIAAGVERRHLADRLHVTRKVVDHALRVMRQRAAAAAGQEPPQRARRPVARRPVEVPGGWTWQEAAACRGEPVELFFGPEGERAQERYQREEEAKAVCGGCSVRTECLDFSIGGTVPAGRWEKYGLYGGLNEDERADLRRKRMKAASNQRLRDAKTEAA